MLLVGIVELLDHLAELLVRYLAVRVRICLSHELQPDLLADLFTVSQRVSDLADFYFSAAVFVEDFEDFQ
jgi:hypothetical protein